METIIELFLLPTNTPTKRTLSLTGWTKRVRGGTKQIPNPIFFKQGGIWNRSNPSIVIVHVKLINLKFKTSLYIYDFSIHNRIRPTINFLLNQWEPGEQSNSKNSSAYS